MTGIVDWLKGKKVYILSVGAILAALGGFLDGALSLTQFIEAAWAALVAMGLRAGVSKAATPSQ